MDATELKDVLLRKMPISKSDGILRMKATVPGTYHYGSLSGNRLNSSTLRSQFLFCCNKTDWDSCGDDVKRLFWSDQYILVQDGDDIWNCYKGCGPTEDRLPRLIEQNIHGLEQWLANQWRVNTSIDTGIYAPYLAAIRTKPFILLAGISGTGKSRMVRELARGCCPRFAAGTTNDHPLYDERKPGNFETIAVRPNWHDSTELLGYVSRISGQDEYQVTDFVRFLCKAWRYEQEGIPFFLCLDEMNLAPVEQYFAEYLSVVESRRHVGGKIVTDPLVRFKNAALLEQVVNEVYADTGLTTGEIGNYFDRFKKAGGIPIPANLVVMGTVNMDETTFSFSRKVLDRAMSFELNEVAMNGGLDRNPDVAFGSIPKGAARQTLVKGFEAYAESAASRDVCDKVVAYLTAINELLDGTPFKIAYRTRDEAMIYCIERCRCGIELARALDEITSMKILSRIEGDENAVRISDKTIAAAGVLPAPLPKDKPRDLTALLRLVVLKQLGVLDGTVAPGTVPTHADYDALAAKYTTCAGKLLEMSERLTTGYTGFWR